MSEEIVEKLIEEEIEASSEAASKKIPEEAWAEMQRLFETGEANGTELSARYGVARSTISRRWKRDGITFASKKPITLGVAPAPVAAAPAVTAPPPAPKKSWKEMRQARIDETKNIQYTIKARIDIAMLKLQADVAAGTMTWKDMINNMKALNLMAKTSSLTLADRRTLLDIIPDPDDLDLPGIVIDDLTEEEIAIIQSNQDVDLEDDGEDLLDDDLEVEEAP